MQLLKLVPFGYGLHTLIHHYHSLANSAVIIKFSLQARPLQKWTVKREMLRRIKIEFDRLGIEIPFPHVTVYQGTAAPPPIQWRSLGAKLGTPRRRLRASVSERARQAMERRLG